VSSKPNSTRTGLFPVWAYLLIILLLALFLRLAGTWRTEFIDYHPDEWVIARPAMSLANNGRVWLKEHYKWPACSVIYPLGYSLYALKGLFGPYSYDGILIIQRVISAIASTAAVFIAFLLTKKMFSTKTALFAVTLLAVAALPVTQGHYGTVTSIVSLVIVSVMLLSYDLFDIGQSQNTKLKTGKCCLLGLICGWGIAAKWTILLAAIPISGALVLSIWFQKRIGKWTEFTKINAKRIGIISGIAVISFLAGIPDFQFLPEKVISGFTYEMKHNKIGHYGGFTSEDRALSRKMLFTGKLLSEGGSIYMLIAGIIAAVFCLCRPSRPRIFLLWTILPWLTILIRNVVTAGRHHLVPFIVMLLLIAAALEAGTGNRRRWLRAACWITFAFLTVSGTLYTCICISPFWKPNARVQCTKWIKANIPTGSGIAGAQGYTVPSALRSIYPHKAEPGKDQYIIALKGMMDLFKKHPPHRKIIPSEWFPSEPPTMIVLLLYAEMNAGGGPNLSLVKEFYTKPSFLGLDLSLFGQPINRETSLANRTVTLFRFKGLSK